MPRLIFYTLLHIAVAGHSQAFENIRVEPTGDTILIRYDLNGPTAGYGVDVRVYSSHDGFRDAITNISGDLVKVRPGSAKSILWKAPPALSNFNGQLSFELRGEIVKDLSFVPTASRKVRRGKATTVEWQGGRLSDRLRIEFQTSEGVPVWSSTVRNEHRAEWVPPVETKKGPGYTYKLRSADGSIVSDTYKVMPKVRRAWFIVPPLVVAGAWYFFIREAPLPAPPGTPLDPD